jgi:hypothetical protein
MIYLITFIKIFHEQMFLLLVIIVYGVITFEQGAMKFDVLSDETYKNITQ